MATPNLAIVDSSALISLVNVQDQLRTQALQIDEVLTAAGWSVLIPSEVLAETLNAIGKKIGRHDSIRVGWVLIDRYNAHDLDFIHATTHTYEKALKLQAWERGSPSFVDCLVMALADEYETAYIFGFDATFKKNGYRLPEALQL
jgi:predicted nucleic acid-binding protein